MVFNRLADPSSKQGVLDWLRETTVLPDFDGGTVHHEQLLRAMDALEENKATVERAVAGQLRPLLDQDLSVIFYDITTVRIHGTGAVQDDLRRHGMSKDTGGIAHQFALGVVQSAEGLPIVHEVFEGNVAEVTTLAPMIERLLERFRLTRVVIVADRGPLSIDNLGVLESLGKQRGLCVDYILAVPARRYSDFHELLEPLHAQFEDRDDDASEDIVCETEWEGRRLVVAHNPERAREQAAQRRRVIDELDALGKQLATRLNEQDAGKSLRGRRASDRGAYKRFHQAVLEKRMSNIVKPDLGSELFRYDIDEAALAAAERLDGKLLLVTSLKDLHAEAVAERYRSLADIERGFRVLNSEIEIAPVFHRLPYRIRAHAVICFLALVLYRVLRMRLKAANSAFSPDRALRVLRQIQQHKVRAGSRDYCGVSRLTRVQMQLFEEVGIGAPR